MTTNSTTALQFERLEQAAAVVRRMTRALLRAGASAPDIDLDPHVGAVEFRWHLTIDKVEDDQTVIDAITKVFGQAPTKAGSDYGTLAIEDDSGLEVKATVWSSLYAGSLRAV